MQYLAELNQIIVDSNSASILLHGDKVEANLVVNELLTCFFKTKSWQQHPDCYAVITTKEDVTVDVVRNIVKFTQTSPSQLSKKFIYLDDAKYLNNAASNALLKVLEEPLDSVVFILKTTNTRLLLPTITSRCHGFYFTTKVPAISKVETETILKITEDLKLATVVTALEIAFRWKKFSPAEFWPNMYYLLLSLLKLQEGLKLESDYLNQELKILAKKCTKAKLWFILNKVERQLHGLQKGSNMNLQLALEDILFTFAS